MKKDFFIVGIGASAGGLEAIESFFKNLPSDSGAAYVIIQHLSPDYKSLMGELLGRHTKLPIYRAEEGMAILPNSVYLIPPRKNMTIYERRLYLTDQTKSSIPNLPIDIFFRSLANDMGKLSIGVILSGTGSDGTLGLKAIKEQGGIIMAQDQDTAKFDGMPRSAIATGMVDFILSPDKMPETVAKFIKHPYIVKDEKKDIKDMTSDEALLRILRIIRDRVGVDFTYYKPNTILRRLEKRLGINQIESFKEYLEFLEHSPKEAQILYKDLLIGVTQFFRDTEAWKLLKRNILPNIFEKRENGLSARIWTVGCSTGEEAYSLAMLLSEYMEEQNKYFDVKIFATDLDKGHIEQASNGLYPESIASDVSPERLDKYFTKSEHGYKIKDSIRRMVIFAQQNIIKDPPFSKIDLITCRNMLIYLNAEMQRKILSMFYFSLISGGGLFLGSSESLGEVSDGFEVISNKWKLYIQKSGFSPPYIGNHTLTIGNTDRPNLGSSRQNFDYLIKDRQIIPDVIFSDLLEAVMPPSVIVSQELKVIHLFKDISKYLRLRPGKASFDLLGMVAKDLSVILSSMLNKVFKDQTDVNFRDIRLKDEKQNLNITARPVKDRVSQKTYAIISFEPASTPKKEIDPSQFDIKSEINLRYSELEKELQYTKENLQATIEELETSNEELQSTNEELVASNEELQSTNEELQSVNEELYTVNTEYQKKIEELTQLNNDMDNLLKNTNIGILYLDRKLRIRKFTKLISKIINIMDMDTGRPIDHISIKMDYSDFVNDIKQVRDTLIPIEKEIKVDDKTWNLIKILPYRTIENAIDGIAIVITDIDSLKASQDHVLQLSERLELAMSMGNLAWWDWDYNSGKVIASDQKAIMLGMKPENAKTFGVNDWTSLIHPEDYEKTMQDMRDHLTGKSKIYETEYRIKTVDGHWKWFYDKGGIVDLHQNKKPKRIAGIVFDITEVKESELAFKHLYQKMAQGVVYQNAKGEIISANPAAERLLGLSLDQMMGRKSIDKRWKSVKEDGSDFPGKEHPAMVALKTGKEVKNVVMGVYHPEKDEQVWIMVSASPMFNAGDKKPYQVFATFEDITQIKTQKEKIDRDYQQFYRILENSPIGKLVVDKDGKIVYTNKEAETIMGVSRDHILHRKYNDKAWDSRDEDGKKIPAAKLPFKLIQNGAKSIRYYYMSVKNDQGERMHIVVHASPMYDINQQLDGAIFSLEATHMYAPEIMKSWKEF